MNQKLGFVMPARNDGYGGNYLSRMQASVDSILSLADKHNVNAELLVVEWNPPSDRPSISEAISWDLADRNVDIRIITVPTDVHNTIPNSDELPFFEYHAKNVGLRRSNASYVVATNSDVIFGEKMFELLPSQLNKDHFYRIGRFDVERLKEAYTSVDELLEYCEENVYRVETRFGWKYRDFDLHRYRRRLIHMMRKGIMKPRKAIRYAWDKVSESSTESKKGEQISEKVDSSIISNDIKSVEDIFLGWSGDFILMHIDHWKSMCGFPEIDHNLHVDNFMLSKAAYYGLNQAVLNDPYRLYHPQHNPDRKGRPGDKVDNSGNYENIFEGNHEQLSFELSAETWGLSNHKLKETRK